MNSFIWLAIGLQLYAGVYALACLTVLRSCGRAPAPWAVTLVWREAWGAVTRRRLKLPTLTRSTSLDDTFRMYRLEPRSAEESEVLAAARQLKDFLNAKGAAYPPSQHQTLMDLTVAAVQFIRMRDAMREQQRANVGVQRKSAWRGVLGIGMHERDPDTIRRAYRTLRSKAHPDKGGSDARMAELSQAMADARKELNFV